MNLEKYNLTRPAVKVFKNGEQKKSHMINNSDNYTFFSVDEYEYLKDNHQKTPFNPKYSFKSPKHLGQLKLFLTNIQFITKYWNIIRHPKPVLLYIGAAPCNWGLLFMKYFPSFEVHLYDPAKFNPALFKESKKNPKLFIHKQLFTEEDMKKWKDNDKDIFLVSDIRLRTYDKEGKDAQKDVHECMILQEKWIKEINPLFSQVKFKLPYEGFNCDNYVYLDGRIYFQAWIGSLSSEARLVSSNPYTSTSYICKEYEEMMFNHNIVTRNHDKMAFKNLFTGEMGPYPLLRDLGLGNDWDSTLTINIIVEYLEKTLVLKEGEKVSEKEVFKFFKTVGDEIVILNKI